MQSPMIMDNPYAAEVITARQRIGRLKERLAHRAAARRDFFADGAKSADAPPQDDQAWPQSQHSRHIQDFPCMSAIYFHSCSA